MMQSVLKDHSCEAAPDGLGQASQVISITSCIASVK